jgi:hypothetical protein
MTKLTGLGRLPLPRGAKHSPLVQGLRYRRIVAGWVECYWESVRMFVASQVRPSAR